ncbi:MAG: calycin-like domain-containing protein [Treponema sp.]|nr:calycin-like domain-containing protein [Treponema sp.]
MKRIIILIHFLFFIFSGIAFSQPAFGNYAVTFSYSMMVKSGEGSSGKGITPLVSLSENKVTLPPFVFSEKMTINSFDIEGVEIMESDGKTTLTCKSFSSYDGKYQIKGSDLKGTIENGKLTLKVTYKAGKMPFKLTVKYESQ